MAWPPLPTTEGSFTLPGNMAANAIGASSDDVLNLATGSILIKYENSIDALEAAFDAAIAALSTTYAVTLVPPNYTAPTVPSAPSNFPTAPTVGVTVLDVAAYEQAFQIANENLLGQKIARDWQISTGSAADGIGLPSTRKAAALLQSSIEYQQSSQAVALEQSRLQAEHLREDTRWSYEQRLAYWQQEFAATADLLRIKLAEQAEARGWWDADNRLKLMKAAEAAQDNRALQGVLVDQGSRLALAETGAWAEMFKALLSAVNWTLSASASITNETYTW